MQIYIYCLTSPSTKKYIGRTKNIKTRFTSYKNTNCRGQPKLYKALKKYGFKNFTTKIIAIVNKNEASSEETKWIKYYNSVNEGYNCVYHDPGPKFMTEKVKNKISSTLKGIKRSKEFKEKQKNKKLSTEFIKNMGRGFSKETCKKIREKWKKEGHPNKGKKLSKETCNKMKIAVRKIAEKNTYQFTSPNGDIFITNRFCDFIEKYNLHKRSVFRVISGERPHHKGWKIRKIN